MRIFAVRMTLWRPMLGICIFFAVRYSQTYVYFHTLKFADRPLLKAVCRPPAVECSGQRAVVSHCGVGVLAESAHGSLSHAKRSEKLSMQRMPH